MEAYKSIIIILVGILIFGCTKQPDPPILFNSSISTEDILYDTTQCGLMLTGQLQLGGNDTEAQDFGFVVSYTIDGSNATETKLSAVGTLDDSGNFNHLYQEYFFDMELSIRSFAQFQDSTIYSDPRMYVQQNLYGDIFRSVELVTGDCGQALSKLSIKANLKCLPKGTEYGILFSRFNAVENNERKTVSIGKFESSTSIDYEFDISELPDDTDVFYFYIINSFTKDRNVYTRYVLPDRNFRSSVEQLNDFPGTPRAEATSIQHDGKGYIIGGYTASKQTYLKDMWEYDLQNDTWKQLADFPGTARAFMTSFKLGDKIYAGSGGTDDSVGNLRATNDFYQYDIANNTWTKIANLPIEGLAGVAFTIQEKAYVGMMLETGGSLNNTFYVYDATVDRWLPQGTNFPDDAFSARASAVTIDNKAYVHVPYHSPAIFSFDPDANQWQRQIDLKIDGNDGIALVRNNKMILATGRNLDYVIEYDPKTTILNTICLDPLINRSEGVGFSFNDKLIIATGIKNLSNEYDFSNTLSSVYSINLF